MVSFKIRAVFATLCSIIAIGMSGISAGDEIIIDNQGDSQFSLGDFRCSSCPTQINSAIGIFDQARAGEVSAGEVSAGELWQFFHSQGVDSLEQLTLCLDIEQLDGQSVFDLQSVELKIEDPRDRGGMLTEFSLGNNSILVPGFETSSFRPEAKLQISLGYDFMERFSADSQEKIKLNFSTNNLAASDVKFSIEGSEQSVFSSWNYLLLGGFVGFWIVVFFVLNRVTKRMADSNPEMDALAGQATAQSGLSKSHPSDRALSA